MARAGKSRLAACFVIQALALGIFVRGFLLTRVELPQVSTCEDAKSGDWPPTGEASAMGSSKESHPVCWGHPRFRRLVLVIVDALRYDFVMPMDGGSVTQSRTPNLLRLHQTSGGASLLAKFVADPPTTTMQRLKGIFTGSLPTFLDVGNAFSATHVSEDSFFSQLSACRLRVACVGDDTWQDLFPEHLSQSWPYPSLNVQDLHTVDNGVWQHMGPLLSAPNGDSVAGYEPWDVLIGHTLGVDHAGHTFNMDAPEMSAKLSETDDRVAEVVELAVREAGPGGLHEGTLMVVMGDHGQTANGDHGGGTPEETDTVLLAFNLAAMNKLSRKTDSAESDGGNTSLELTIPQLQLLPTLSLLLGIPIPFGSIGSVSPDLWALGIPSTQTAQEQLPHLRDALAKNAWQVHRYLLEYNGGRGGGGRFNDARLSECFQLHTLSGQLHNRSLEDAGITQDAVEAHQAFLTCAVNLAKDQWTQFSLTPMVVGILLLFAVLLWQVNDCVAAGQFANASWELYGIAGAVVFLSVMQLSDSYIWEEPRVVSVVVVATVSLLYLQILRISYGKSDGEETSPKGERKGGFRAFLAWAVVLAATRAMTAVGHMTPQHRLEPPDTFPGSTESPIPTLARHADSVIGGEAWLFLGSAVVAFQSLPLPGGFSSLAGAALILTWHIAEDAIGKPDVAIRGIIEAAALEQETFSMELPAGLHDLPLRLLVPRLVFLLTGLGVLGCLATRFSGNGDRSESGANGCSNRTTGLALNLLPSLVLLFGRRGPLLAFLALLQLWGCFVLLRARRLMEGDAEIRMSTGVHQGGSWLCAVGGALLGLLGQHFFFCTGHTSQFAGLQYTAGFVGYDEFNYVRAGFLLASNTFGPQILTTLLVPRIAELCAPADDEDSDGRNNGGRLTQQQRQATMAAKGYAMAQSCPLLLATFGAAIHRRHLMAWSIFAPNFVFSGITFLVSHVALQVAVNLAN